jgi:hypothetical protein
MNTSMRRNMNMSRSMKIRIILKNFFLGLFLIAGINQARSDEILPYQYVYNSQTDQDKKIDLYISFSCAHCQEALEILVKYLKTRPKAKVRIYFYCADLDSAEFYKYFLATADNLDLQVELMKHIINGTKKEIIRFAKKQKIIIHNLIEHKSEYEIFIRESKKQFKEKKIELTPTWIISGIKIEGIPDNIHKILQAKTLKVI